MRPDMTARRSQGNRSVLRELSFFFMSLAHDARLIESS